MNVNTATKAQELKAQKPGDGGNEVKLASWQKCYSRLPRATATAAEPAYISDSKGSKTVVYCRPKPIYVVRWSGNPSCKD